MKEEKEEARDSPSRGRYLRVLLSGAIFCHRNGQRCDVRRDGRRTHRDVRNGHGRRIGCDGRGYGCGYDRCDHGCGFGHEDHGHGYRGDHHHDRTWSSQVVGRGLWITKHRIQWMRISIALNIMLCGIRTLSRGLLVAALALGDLDTETAALDVLAANTT
jgi:hypothetical protein